MIEPGIYSIQIDEDGTDEPVIARVLPNCEGYWYIDSKENQTHTVFGMSGNFQIIGVLDLADAYMLERLGALTDREGLTSKADIESLK